MDLNTSLRQISADPPPNRIDLDALIRAEERRGYRQRRLVGAGVVSGVTVLVGAASVGWPTGSQAPIGDGAEPPCPWVSPSGYPPFSNPPPPSTAASVPVSVPSAGPPADVPSVSPGRSPAETCDDTMRRLERVLRDALARIAPNAHPATPIRFFRYPKGDLRATVVFDGGGKLIVTLFPRLTFWSDGFHYYIRPSNDGYEFGNPNDGLLSADPAAGPLSADQLHALADDLGLTLIP